jgi:catechol 2,3-dioxygenase-like lactoylglutathione lyase family enzyme
MRIHHTAISTPNLERLVRFYRELFGFAVVREFGWPRGVPMINGVIGLPDCAAQAAMLRRGDSFLELFEFSHPAPAPQAEDRPACDHGFTHVCFLVDDVAAEQARCEALGMRFHSKPQSTADLTFTYGRDPDGNVIELLRVHETDHPFALKASAA